MTQEDKKDEAPDWCTMERRQHERAEEHLAAYLAELANVQRSRVAADARADASVALQARGTEAGERTAAALESIAESLLALVRAARRE